MTVEQALKGLSNIRHSFPGTPLERMAQSLTEAIIFTQEDNIMEADEKMLAIYPLIAI